MFYWLAKWLPVSWIICLSAKFDLLHLFTNYDSTNQAGISGDGCLTRVPASTRATVVPLPKQNKSPLRNSNKTFLLNTFSLSLKVFSLHKMVPSSVLILSYHLHFFSPLRTRKDRFIRFGTMTRRVFVPRRTR